MDTKVTLYVPKLEDLWFRQECMADPETMSYNAGYDVCTYDYHYDTGCIDFFEENHKSWFDKKMSNPNFYYAYILDKNTKKFVGYLNFKNDPNSKSATMGIVVKNEYRGNGYMRLAMPLLLDEAKKRGVKFLTDTVPKSREGALKVFFDLGFEKIDEFNSKKFNKDDLVYEIQKEL